MTDIHTSEFTTTSGDYLKALLTLWLPKHLGYIIAPIFALVVSGVLTHDWRLELVALMLVFIVIPMGMSFLYTYYMLTPEARRAVLPKRVDILPDREVKLTFAEDGDDERIPWEMVREVKFSSLNSAIIIVLRSKRLKFILVPYAACQG